MGVRAVGLSTGVFFAYVPTGADSGTSVVLLHAWGESHGSFDRVTPLLPAHIRALAVDQRGHGDTDRPDSGYALTDYADDVVAFMDALDLPAAVLVGSSSGGYVAQQVAVSHPARVAGLVLVGSPRSLQTWPPFADEVERLRDPVERDWVARSLTWFPRFQDVPDDYLEDRVRDGLRIPAHVWREAFRGLVEALPPTDVGPVHAPTLVLWGERDELLSRQEQEDLVAAIPGARLETSPDAGHLLLWELPGFVAEQLTAFVDELTRPGRQL